jgi:hypothetical protein
MAQGSGERLLTLKGRQLRHEAGQTEKRSVWWKAS